jgi:IMP dehydrogenase
MEVEIGRGKKARRAYGFDDIAIVPSRRTRDPDDVDITWKLGDYRFDLPLMASAMDGVVSPKTAGIVGKLGGLAVLNLEGIWTRYENADEILERIAGSPRSRPRARCRRSTRRRSTRTCSRSASARSRPRASSSPRR